MPGWVSRTPITMQDALHVHGIPSSSPRTLESRCKHFFLQYIQTLLAIIIPTKRHILLQKYLHGCNDLCICFDEICIISCMIQCHVQLFDIPRRLQIDNYYNFGKVHHQPLLTKYTAQEYPIWYIEYALLEIKGYLILLTSIQHEANTGNMLLY